MNFLIPLGRILITSTANEELNREDVLEAIQRHGTGDWGELGEGDMDLNDQAVLNGSRILSAYHDRNNIKFWIITEADRSSTTILLPDDY